MVEITRAVRGDLPDLVRLLGLLFAQEAEYQPDVKKQERGLSLLLNSPESAPIFVARERGKAIGMVTLLYTVSTAEGGQTCSLEDMIVDPNIQGGGVGSQLVLHAIEYARARGITRITLLTDGDNERAMRFYERHGFVASAMRPMRLHF